ncbi:type 1 glutamine amidotransferase-like domain-containing protein [Candidatus Roizmanbacteria bacterium]|nr:type 1 glutamine amidotransferase-like domain-containing protein [Candidatus Roizmanbacteria bacterium]
MTLLLTSAGVGEGLRDIFLALLPKAPQDISVSYIVTAAFGEEGEKSWLYNAKKQLEDVGITDIEDLDLRGKTKEDLYAVLSQKDIILVNGGNTFFLLKYVKESGFNSVVKDLINQGKIYIGVSAGSYIACPTIEHAYWKHQDRNDCGVTDLTALSLVPFFVIAHFTGEVRRVVAEGALSTAYPVVALSDTQAVLVKGKSVQVVGEGKREFFNGFEEK